MTTDERLEERLTKWIAGFLRVAPGKITQSTSINLDLGVDGDDGVELISSFGKTFAVDVSDFPYSKYFGPEASHPFGLLGTAMRVLFRRKTADLEPLYVRDLMNMIERAAK
jgi:acyl carrier protein